MALPAAAPSGSLAGSPTARRQASHTFSPLSAVTAGSGRVLPQPLLSAAAAAAVAGSGGGAPAPARLGKHRPAHTLAVFSFTADEDEEGCGSDLPTPTMPGNGPSKPAGGSAGGAGHRPSASWDVSSNSETRSVASFGSFRSMLRR